MKNLFTPPSIVKRSSFIILLFILISYLTFAQDEFIETSFKLNKENDTEMKKHMKAYKTFELNIKDLKKILRKKKGLDTPTEFTLIVDSEKTKFTVFENDIFDENYVEIENGVRKTKDKIEINTYAGFVDYDSKNALRLFISDDRISGFFNFNNTNYLIRNLSDYGISEKKNSNKIAVVIAKEADEISNLSGMTCGNGMSNKGAKMAAAACPTYSSPCTVFPTCKFVKLIVASDYEFYQRFANLGNINTFVPSSITAQNVILDFVNRIDFIMFRDFNLRIRLAMPPIVKTTVNDGFPETNSGGVTLVGPEAVLQAYSQSNVISSAASSYGLTLSSGIINHYLTGKGLTTTSINDAYGQSDECSLCGYAGKTPNSLNTIVRKSNNTVISYSDAYLTMAHEITHTIGADHDCSSIVPGNTPGTTSSKSIMCDDIGKVPHFSNLSKSQVNCYLQNQGSCLLNNQYANGFSNFMTLKLNGVNTSTPMLIKNNIKTLAIAPNPPYTLLSSSFTKNNASVITYSTSLTQTQFQINTAPNFTMSVSAQDQCNSYLSNVFFVYSAAGLRVSSNVYPNPSDGNFTVENVSAETLNLEQDISKIHVINEKGEILKEIIYKNEAQKSIFLRDFNSGIYYLKIFRTNGEQETKRIKIEK